MVTSGNVRSRASGIAALAALLLLTGCATVQLQNRQPAQELAQAARPPGSVYAGWRVFQERCAGCHGESAAGTAKAPDLLERMRTMGPRQFVSSVLNRYDWGLSPSQAGSDGAVREVLVEEIMQRRQGALSMPAWRGEPSVNAHIADLHAYLAARAEGSQGPGRPAP